MLPEVPEVCLACVCLEVREMMLPDWEKWSLHGQESSLERKGSMQVFCSEGLNHLDFVYSLDTPLSAMGFDQATLEALC